MKIHCLVFFLLSVAVCAGRSGSVLPFGSAAQTNQREAESKTSSRAKLPQGYPDDVSIVQLVANPEKYHGKFVRLKGFVRIEFEGTAIYLHEDDYKYALTRNGLWLSLSEGCCGKDAKAHDQKYVLVEGTFNAENQGHMGLWSGSVEKISRFDLWADKKGWR